MTKANNIASFVLRFRQHLWQDTAGEPHMEWRGHIRYVQGDDEYHFTDFTDAVLFMQKRLTRLALENAPTVDPANQGQIANDNFKLWQKFAASYTSLMVQTMDQTFKQSGSLREQVDAVKDQALKALSGSTTSTPPETASTEAEVLAALAELRAEILSLSQRVDHLSEMVKSQQVVTKNNHAQ